MQKKGQEASERIRMRDAAIFPFYASAALFGLYIVFKVRVALFIILLHTFLTFLQYLPKEYVNLLLSVLFFSVGVSALSRAGR